MKFTVVIDKDREEEVVLYLKSPSSISDRIREICESDKQTILAFDELGATKLSLSDIYAFTVSDGKVYAVADQEKFRIRQRLYEIEETAGASFVKINQSCIVNISFVKRFYSSFGCSLTVELKNGFKDYVSRRQIKAVKERLGLK